MFRLLLSHPQVLEDTDPRLLVSIIHCGISSSYKCGILMRREENQLDVTESFIALMLRSTCFGRFYVHHQVLDTICVLLPPMVCSAWLLVVGGQVQGSRL